MEHASPRCDLLDILAGSSRLFRIALVALACTLVAPNARATGSGDHDAERAAQASSALHAIESAARAGEITSEEELLYKLYLAVGSAELPEPFQGSPEPIRCGTALVLEVESRLGELSDAGRETYRELTGRPTAVNDHVDTEHFRIHFATGGEHAIQGWPSTAYLDAVAEAAEAAWNRYHRDEQWEIPPSDGTGGGDGRIDIYVVDLGAGLFGYAAAEDDPEDARPANRTAFLVIDNDYAGFGYTRVQDPMRVTVAHEYHHVVQMGYTIENRWWMENVSTFMEDEVFDEIDDNHNFLSCFTSKPNRRLDLLDGCHEYGAFLWPTFLKERWSHDVVRRIHEASATRSLYSCFDDVLSDVGSSLDEAFAEFAAWNFYTSYRDDGNHYLEGAEYRSVVGYDQVVGTYPRGEVRPSAGSRPERLGTSVVRLLPEAGSPDNTLTLVYRGPECTQQVVVFQKLAGSDVVIEHYVNLNVRGDGSLDIVDWDETEYAHVFVSLPWVCGEGAFDYLIEVDTDVQVTDVPDDPALFTRRVELDQNQPNPFGSSTKIRYGIRESGPVRLEIFDAAGRRVRALVDAAQDAGAFTVWWDGRDDAGREVSPGVYFFRVQSGADALMKKMIVIGD